MEKLLPVRILSLLLASSLCSTLPLMADSISENQNADQIQKSSDRILATHPIHIKNRKDESPVSIRNRKPNPINPDLSTSPDGYKPSQIRHAYGFDQIANLGAGQTIAIIDSNGSPTIQQDLNTFSAAFGLPTTTVKIYYPQGQPSADSGWALETSLDVEWAHAIAPQATIALVVVSSASLNNLLGGVDYAVQQLGAKQVSMSWGGSEFRGETSYDSHFKNASGVSFFASSGDSGAGASWPAACPYVTAVGGTTLDLSANGTISAETAWSGSGGGVSSYEKRPAFQNTWQNKKGRGIPDVSYNADPNTGYPVYISNYNGSTGWITVGGTSASAPQWAAMTALINAQRTGSLTSLDADLYTTAGTSYGIDFRDVTIGNNGGYSATPKYDFVTGLGSPVASQLIPALVAPNSK